MFGTGSCKARHRVSQSNLDLCIVTFARGPKVVATPRRERSVARIQCPERTSTLPHLQQAFILLLKACYALLMCGHCCAGFSLFRACPPLLPLNIAVCLRS